MCGSRGNLKSLPRQDLATARSACCGLAERRTVPRFLADGCQIDPVIGI